MKHSNDQTIKRSNDRAGSIMGSLSVVAQQEAGKDVLLDLGGIQVAEECGASPLARGQDVGQTTAASHYGVGGASAEVVGAVVSGARNGRPSRAEAPRLTSVGRGRGSCSAHRR